VVSRITDGSWSEWYASGLTPATVRIGLLLGHKSSPARSRILAIAASSSDPDAPVVSYIP